MFLLSSVIVMFYCRLKQFVYNVIYVVIRTVGTDPIFFFSDWKKVLDVNGSKKIKFKIFFFSF